MIIDLTDSFYSQASTSRSAHTQSNWHSSQFIKTSTSYLADLTSLDFKLNDLDKCKFFYIQAFVQVRGSRGRLKVNEY